MAALFFWQAQTTGFNLPVLRGAIFLATHTIERFK
jgi:hypothetical protein